MGSWPELTLTLGQFLSGVGILLIAFGVVYWICRGSFSAGKKKGPWILLFVLFFGLLCLGFFLRRPLAALPFPAAAGGIAVLFLIYKVLDARLD